MKKRFVFDFTLACGSIVSIHRQTLKEALKALFTQCYIYGDIDVKKSDIVKVEKFEL